MSPVKNCGHRPVQRRRLMEKYRLLQKFGHPTDGDRSGYFRPLQSRTRAAVPEFETVSDRVYVNTEAAP